LTLVFSREDAEPPQVLVQVRRMLAKLLSVSLVCRKIALELLRMKTLVLLFELGVLSHQPITFDTDFVVGHGRPRVLF